VKCFLDIMQEWGRIFKIFGLQLPFLLQDEYLVYPSQIRFIWTKKTGDTVLGKFNVRQKKVKSIFRLLKVNKNKRD